MRDDAVFQFGATTGFVELPTSWSLDDFPYFEYLRAGARVYPGLQNTSEVLENWVGDFDFMTRHEAWGVLTYTCHPYVVGRGHRMRMLERLIEQLTEKGAAWLTIEQAIEVFKHRLAGLSTLTPRKGQNDGDHLAPVTN